ncbi:MAG: amidohydrolase 2, partial [Rhizobacter sp.]|nr:amidohydrolase 2 [Rhizobacter sp.]
MGLFASESPTAPRQFGRVYPPRHEWLKMQAPEAILEPDLPIVDTHYHVWDMPGNRYLIEELSADLATGHRIEAMVFNECLAMYRKDGPEAMRPVGETQFVAGMAAMSESGQYGPTHIGAGIVSFADLTLGAAVEEVLAAHVAVGGGRFKGTRYGAAWDASPVIGNSHTNPRLGVMNEPGMRAGLKVMRDMKLSLDAWVFFHQLDDI